MINFQIIILGKSGAKFYASYDELYVIKTLTSEEIEQMHSLLKQYHPFVVERHGKLISLSNAGTGGAPQFFFQKVAKIGTFRQI